MPKRFTDTDIWKDQRWFRKLAPAHKLAFFYIKDRCNHAGLWKIDCNDLMEDTGVVNFNLPDFLMDVNTEFDGITGERVVKDRIIQIKKSHIWITGFLQFQYEGKDKKVAWKGGPAFTAMLQLESFTLIDQGLTKGYITLKEPLLEGWQTLKDKDKDKDKIHLTSENKKNGNSKFGGNFKTQGDDLYARRTSEGQSKTQ
jgi:hypothetical protein